MTASGAGSVQYSDPGDVGEYDLWHHGDSEARGVDLDFAVNVLADRPPPFVAKALSGALAHVAAYPHERPAHERLAAHLNIDSASLLLVNGVAEAFALVAALRPWKAPVVVHPQFTEPEAALRGAGARPRRVLASPADHFALRPSEVPSGADLVMVGNPTNPTSRLHRADRLIELRAPQRLLVVDEAFIDVVPNEAETLLRVATERCGLLVLRSLTKTFSLAGIRAGYVVGHPEEIRSLAARRPPWSVNSLALAAIEAIASREGDAYVAEMRRTLAQRRPHLVDGLSARGFEVIPHSAGPFVLARHPQARSIREALRARGVGVRRGDTFPGLDDTWLRLALRSRVDCERLFGALDAVLK